MVPEGRYDLVAPDHAAAAVLVLHPHPEMGGDRFHPVVDAVFLDAAAAGWAACRFDFSSGRVAVSVEEARWALDLLPDAPVTVVGYSYGAAVAAALVDPRIAAWVLVAPPFGAHVPAAGLPAGGDARSKLVLVPEHDQWCPPAIAAAETVSWTATEVETVPMADHFLAGATTTVADRVHAQVNGGR
jgi:alpha/beta superfamily hydrolase